MDGVERFEGTDHFALVNIKSTVKPMITDIQRITIADSVKPLWIVKGGIDTAARRFIDHVTIDYGFNTLDQHRIGFVANSINIIENHDTSIEDLYTYWPGMHAKQPSKSELAYWLASSELRYKYVNDAVRRIGCSPLGIEQDLANGYFDELREVLTALLEWSQKED